MKWEYKAEKIPLKPSDALRTDLNGLGQQGWELVTVATSEGLQIAYFKRPLTAPSTGG
jgi:hypothetical protein